MPPVAILAGGLATRLRPLTDQTPKALVPVLGEPFIAHQLRLLKREGVSDVVMLVGYLGERIAAFVGIGEAFGLRVRYSYDGPKLLGTGGALKQALPLLGAEFMVLYGDSYLDIPMRPVVDAFQTSDQPALMTVLRNDGRWDKSNARLERDSRVCYDKRNPTPDMQWIDYGLGVLDASVFEPYEAGQAFDLASLYERLSGAGKLMGFEVRNRFYEIGSLAGLAETESYLRGASSQ